MEHYSLTAWPLLDRLNIALTTATTTETGRTWQVLVQEQDELPAWALDHWDVVWLIGYRLQEAALRHGTKAPGL